MPNLDKMLAKRTTNVLLLSLSFLLVFISFQTMSNVLITILKSVSEDNPSYEADSKIALAIVYIVFALSNFIAPAVVGAVGTRAAMVIGAAAYALYVGSFNLVVTEVLYVVSFIVGVGAAIIWTAQGTYLTLNSDHTTMARNSGVFWALFQCSILIGNLFVFFAFQDKNHIDSGTRTVVYNVLTGFAILGILLLYNLGTPKNAEGEDVEEHQERAYDAMMQSFALFTDYRILLLCCSFWCTGTLLTFAGSIYSSAIGFTQEIAANPKPFVGLSGVLFGLGEVVGGSLFGLFGSKTTIWGRNPIITLGTLTLTACYALIYLNLPDKAAFDNTSDTSYFSKPLISVALLCSFLLGFGDSCFETQIYSIIGTLFKDNSAPAFASFKFVQSVACGVAFVYVKYMGLHIQIITLFVQLLIAAATFIIVEIRVTRTENSAVVSTRNLAGGSTKSLEVTTSGEGWPIA